MLFLLSRLSFCSCLFEFQVLLTLGLRGLPLEKGRYSDKCGDDKGACVAKANELCPKGYTMSNETNKTQMSFNAWRGSSESEITLEVQCK